MGGTMKDDNGILPKINAGIYKLANRSKGKSEIWNLFAEIKRTDGTLVHGFLCCRKCMSLHKFDGKRTSNLNRHRCYKMLMNNGGKVKRFFEMMEGSLDNDGPENPLASKKCIADGENDNEDDSNTRDSREDVRWREDGGAEDTKGGNDTDYCDETQQVNDDDVDDGIENITEDVKIQNPLDLKSHPDDSQHYEPRSYKRKKYTPYITPTRVQRNLTQLNTLCEMIKSDLIDAPDDLFFVAKWKIMDVLRDVQSKRLGQQNYDLDSSKATESKNA
ncbi:uncharacterized protein [Eurosta solidaginis]|uniref:uncharacterized protein n=1 Tax=Eurosta solidaginis TaxID=178769 RepID=UPI003530AF83